MFYTIITHRWSHVHKLPASTVMAGALYACDHYNKNYTVFY